MGNTVYWAELQNALSGVGLKVSVDIPRPRSPWFGKIDDKIFTMTISSKSDKDGIRDFLIVSLYGQDEEKTISLLSKFMGYKPFCKYQHKKNTEATATYEWDRKDPVGRLQEVKEDSDIFDVEEFQEGYQIPDQNMDRYFQEFTVDIIEKWEEVLEKNPDAEWSHNKIRDILPFVKKVMPRVGRNQSLFGLSIISLDGRAKDEKIVVRHGLAPLLSAGILTLEEAEKIVDWYSYTKPSWDSMGGDFIKNFEIDGVRYRLYTDSSRNHRDVNLQTLS